MQSRIFLDMIFVILMTWNCDLLEPGLQGNYYLQSTSGFFVLISTLFYLLQFYDLGVCTSDTSGFDYVRALSDYFTFLFSCASETIT